MERTEKRIKKLKRAKSKLLQDTGCPTRAGNAYAIFVKEKSGSGRNPMSQAAEEWQRMSEAEKQKYNEKYAAERPAYEARLAQWEKKMAGTKEMEELQRINELLRMLKSRRTAKAVGGKTKE